MGISKIISALGKCDLYTSNYVAFAQKIAEVFNVNVSLLFFVDFDEKNTEYEKPAEFFDFGKKERVILSVDYFKIDEEKLLQPENIEIRYELYIPHKFDPQNDMILKFYKNGIIKLQLIPLSNFWGLYIDNYKLKNQVKLKIQTEIIQETINVRHLYSTIFKKLNCFKVVLWSGMYFDLEDKINESDITLEEFMNFLEEVCNTENYNFREILSNEKEISSYVQLSLDVALIDNLDQEIEIESCLKLFN